MNRSCWCYGLNRSRVERGVTELLRNVTSCPVVVVQAGFQRMGTTFQTTSGLPTRVPGDGGTRSMDHHCLSPITLHTSSVGPLKEWYYHSRYTTEDTVCCCTVVDGLTRTPPLYASVEWHHNDPTGVHFSQNRRFNMHWHSPIGYIGEWHAMSNRRASE